MPSKTGAGAGAGAGGFIGFSAFADPSSTIAGAAVAAAGNNANNNNDNASAGGASTNGRNNNINGNINGKAGTAAAAMGPTPTPVFTGSDPHLHQLFRRIGQKKDATTRVRALDELTVYAFGGGTSAAASVSAAAAAAAASAPLSPNLSRQDKVAALSHLAYLALTKLLWDNAPSVRAATLSALTAAAGAVPKAWRGLVLYGAPRLVQTQGQTQGQMQGQDKTVVIKARPNTDAMLVLPDGGLSSSGLTVAALVYVLACDPSSEVAAAADSFLRVGRLLLGEEEEEKEKGGNVNGGGNGNSSNKQKKMRSSDNASASVNRNPISNKRTLLQCSVINFALAALKLGGADALDGAIFGTGGSGSGTCSGNNSHSKQKGKGGKKQQQQQQQQQYHNGAGGSEKSDAQREESEERYERMVMAVLGAMSMLVKADAPATSSDNDIATATSTANVDYANLIVQEEGKGEQDALWRHLTSSRSPFRRATYAMLSDLASQCQGGPSLLHGCGSKTKKNKKSLADHLPTAIANERDPGNVPKMLSFVLSYLASSRKMMDANNQQSSGASIVLDVDRGGIDCTKLVSALSKLFRRGCHGSPAIGWAPIVLPLVACLPRLDGSNALQRKILAALWEGRSAAIGGGANDAAIVTAVVEVAAYLLLRRLEVGADENGNGDNDDVDAKLSVSEDEARDISQYIFRSLQYYLCESDTDTKRDGSSTSTDELCATLCRDLQRIDAACVPATQKVDCILHPVRNWFWAKDGVGKIILDAIGSEDNVLAVTRLGDLVKVAHATANHGVRAQSLGHHLAPILRDSVSAIGVNTVDRSSSSPSSSSGPPNYANIKLLLEVMRYCGTFSVIKVSGDNDDAAVALYISSAIVPWIIATFSSSSMASTSSYRQAYAEILCLCLDCILSNDRRREAWSAALNSMVRAHVDLSFLTDLIAEVQIPTKATASIIRCDALDDFATQVGEAASLLFHQKALSEQTMSAEESRGMRHLLQTLVGLTSHCSQMLVGQGVVQKWIAFACPESKENENIPLLISDIGCNDILLDVLLTVASKGDFLTESNVLRIMIQSFREGGHIWESKALQLPATHPQYQHIMKNLEESAKSVLKQDLEKISRLQKRLDADRFCRIWSERCIRLFQLCSDSKLDLVGLNDVEIWAASHSTPTLRPSPNADFDVDIDICAQINPLYACLKLVLQHFDPDKRREMLCGNMHILDTASMELVLHVLLSLSHAVPSQVPNTTASRQQLCHNLFDLLCDLPRPYLLDLCKQTIAFISREMDQVNENGKSREIINRAVVVLDVLADKAFSRRSISSEGTCAEDDEVDQDNIREGEKLYYVAKGENGSIITRVQCRVTKIHTDDYPNLYFTIRIEGEGGVVSERQTVANRLCKLPKAQPSTSEQQEKENGDGAGMTALLLDQIIKPHLFMGIGEAVTHPSTFVVEAAAECCSIAISKFGLGEKSGIGTVRYEIFQIISSLEQSARNSLVNAVGQAEVAATSLRCLAFALGYGALTQFSSTNVEALKICPTELVGSIYDAIDSATKTKRSIISTLMWLTVALSSSSTEGDVFRQAMYVLEVASQKLSRQLDSQDDLVLLLRSFSTIQKHAHGCIDYSSTDTNNEKDILANFVRNFVATSVDDEEDAEPPPWLDLFSSLVEYNLTRDDGNGKVLFYGAREWSEGLCDTLFSPLKRRCGYRLLATIASERIMTNPSGQVPIETRRHLKKWKANLDSEEAEELHDDAVVTSKWLPECLVNLVGDWSEISDEDRRAEDEDERIGKLLSWLACLNFLDNAAAVDIRNRNAITSYFDQAATVTEILASAVEHAKLTDTKVTGWISCLDSTNAQGDPVTLSDVATLAVFMTMESVPTLAKKWYLDFCPRSIASQISDFVEKRVAPLTLMRELSRIKNMESTFGEMIVTGSYVSRIVTATYVQDESNLSVQISVPSSFPLRNAEVDCRKTLGIPTQRWRRWELMITRMLNHEDGSILDALLLWKNNCDKEFDGVEPCPVCYSVLCVKTHAMPNLECRTCSNRFHSNCLMKWFKTSGKSLCVMCQQPWSGTKIT